MKNKRIVEVLGSVILAVSLGITGCTVKIEDDKKTEKSEKETTEETTEETEDPCCCEVDECEISYCGSCVSYEDDYEFVSTNGELEGQLDYMELAPRCEDINWDAYPDDLTIDDLSVIEDEDMRNLAQECVDCGYVVDDPELDALIVAGRASADTEERKSIYKDAMEIIMDWGCELPLYQRKDCTTVSTQRVVVDSVPHDMTPYWGWYAEIETIEAQ